MNTACDAVVARSKRSANLTVDLGASTTKMLDAPPRRVQECNTGAEHAATSDQRAARNAATSAQNASGSDSVL